MSRTKLESVLQDYFNIDLEKYLVNFEQIHRERMDPDAFDKLKEEYRKVLVTHPDRANIQKRLYLGDDLIIQIQGIFEYKELERQGLDLSLSAYFNFCANHELIAIKNPNSPMDLLLRERADAIANNPRLTRLYISRRNKNKSDWTLTSEFDDKPFTGYKKKLPDHLRTKCDGIPAGFAFTEEPNGVCKSTPLGNIIYVSESLRYFLYYMNTFLTGLDLNFTDRFHAFLIAVRMMMLTEALDFESDTRGDLPIAIHKRMLRIVKYQMNFVIGHEYAHHLLGHVGTLSSSKSNIHGIEDAVILNYKQVEELQADYESINSARYSESEKSNVINGALIFFLGLHMYELVKDYYSPSNTSFKTHPEPLQRMWKLQEMFGSIKSVYSKGGLQTLLDELDGFKKYLLEEFLPFHVDAFETTGSVFLPSYRKETLIDRFDY